MTTNYPDLKQVLARGVGYEEVTVADCYRQILKELGEISAAARGSGRPTSYPSSASRL